MAISVNGGGGGGGGFRSRRRGGSGMIAEINVTPFVDVVLVLLIIFMLTAHVMEYGLEVDVPKTKAAKQATVDLPTVSILKDGEFYLNEKPVNNIANLKAEIQQRFGTSTKGVYVKADKEAIWDIIAQVVAELGQAGFQVNMVTTPDESGGKGAK